MPGQSHDPNGPTGANTDLQRFLRGEAVENEYAPEKRQERLSLLNEIARLARQADPQTDFFRGEWLSPAGGLVETYGLFSLRRFAQQEGRHDHHILCSERGSNSGFVIRTEDGAAVLMGEWTAPEPDKLLEELRLGLVDTLHFQQEWGSANLSTNLEALLGRSVAPPIENIHFVEMDPQKGAALVRFVYHRGKLDPMSGPVDENQWARMSLAEVLTRSDRLNAYCEFMIAVDQALEESGDETYDVAGEPKLSAVERRFILDEGLDAADNELLFRLATSVHDLQLVAAEIPVRTSPWWSKVLDEKVRDEEYEEGESESSVRLRVRKIWDEIKGTEDGKGGSGASS